MNTLKAFFLSLVILILMPFAPASEDRILAARIYRRRLGFERAARDERRFWSLCAWLDRAAERQRRINGITQAEYAELKARCWDRNFSYRYLIGRFLLGWTVLRGVDRIDHYLLRECPSVYFWLEEAAASILRGLHFLLPWVF